MKVSQWVGKLHTHSGLEASRAEVVYIPDEAFQGLDDARGSSGKGMGNVCRTMV